MLRVTISLLRVTITLLRVTITLLSPPTDTVPTQTVVTLETGHLTLVILYLKYSVMESIIKSQVNLPYPSLQHS